MLDGMILLDHPGPKGQTILKNGEHRFFCDTKGLIATLFDPSHKNKIKQAFVQDFGARKWGSYSNNWIDVKQAFFVMDSSRFGAMGPTLVTFGTRADAETFAQEFGGSVLAFSELNEEKFEAYQKRIRQQLRDAIGTISNSVNEEEHQHQ
jgi:copper chaperone NosL